MRRYRRQAARAERLVAPRRRHALHPAMAFLLGATVLLFAWYRGALTPVFGISPPRTLVSIEGRLVAVPAPVPGATRPLPAVPVTTQGSYAFLNTTPSGRPVGFDPCRPIRFVVRPDGAPAVGNQLIAEAVATISRATGLSFVDAGFTTEVPILERPLVQARYGSGWVPVLFAWSDPTVDPELAGSTAGLGGSSVVPAAAGSDEFLAGGRVLIDGPDIAAILATPDGYARARAILVHELAHVVGLDHVSDPTELMAPVMSGLTSLGPGDLQGLALVGQIACDGA